MPEQVLEQYVPTPQNDLQQIRLLSQEYEADPARGLAHGLQKDAIQNGVGARFPGMSEPNSYRKWEFSFKLFKVDGRNALSFWDSGTTGLTGAILSAEEISRWSAEDKLTAEQKLSRFLSRFDSGGNIGPGSFGRGKLIFQAASKTYTIVCDSKRFDDGKYIAFDRKLVNNTLVQTPIPHQDEDAMRFMERISHGTLKPLQEPGTRVTILDVRDEIVDVIMNSFREDRPEIAADYSSSFLKMIEETWWEILDKFDARIFVECDGKKKRVILGEPLKSVARAKDHEKKWRIQRLYNIDAIVQNKIYKIKELLIALSPDNLNEEIRGIWIQRKRMKIGLIKGISPDQTVTKKVCGYVILDPDLEDEIEQSQSEGLTHYGFNFRRGAPNQIKQIVEGRLQTFQEELGIKTASDSRTAKKSMLDVLKDVNEISRKLGLISTSDVGLESDVEISIETFDLPNKDSARVDIGDTLGPIAYKVTNNKGTALSLELVVRAIQTATEKGLLNKRFVLGADKSERFVCPAFQLSEVDFRNGEALRIIAKVNSRSNGETLCQSRRTLWVGMDPPVPGEKVTVSAYKPIFPREKSARVELGESIKRLRFKISNQTASSISVNVDLLSRRSPTSTLGELVLTKLLSEHALILQPMSDRWFTSDALEVKGEEYAAINDAPPNPEDRKCDVFFSARLSDHVRLLNMVKGENIGRKKIDFYVGVDPPGESIFKNVRDWPAAHDGRRSKHEGDRASGYTFFLNVAHPAYAFVESYQDEELKQAYIREQMLVQAYAIAVKEGQYTGIARKYKDRLTDVEVSPADAFLVFQEMVGSAVSELQ